MITRPLDLNSRLRPRPRSFDWVFFFNIALIAMFFLFFGSRFILSPALVIKGDGFRLPSRPENQVSYVPGTVVVSIKANGQIFTGTGLVTHSQLGVWLGEQIKRAPDASLILRADENVTLAEIMRIQAIASKAGFKQVSSLVETEKTERPGAAQAGGER